MATAMSLDGGSRLHPPSQDDKELNYLVTLHAMPRRDHHAGRPMRVSSTLQTGI